MAAQTLSVGVVGFRAARWMYAPALAHAPGVRVAAWTDPNRETAGAASDAYRGRAAHRTARRLPWRPRGIGCQSEPRSR